MYVWELVAHRLRCEGWSVWHRSERASAAPTYTVMIHRPGAQWRASGPTLTEAFAAAARRARAGELQPWAEPRPHFALSGAGGAPPSL